MVCMPLRGSERESEGTMALQYRIRRNQANGAVLHLSGRLVAGGGALQLRGLSRQFVNQHIEVDLAEVSAVDAAGLGSLVCLYNQVHSNGGQLALVNVPAHVAQLLRLSGLAAFLRPAGESQEPEIHQPETHELELEREKDAICVEVAIASPAA